MHWSPAEQSSLLLCSCNSIDEAPHYGNRWNFHQTFWNLTWTQGSGSVLQVLQPQKEDWPHGPVMVSHMVTHTAFSQRPAAAEPIPHGRSASNWRTWVLIQPMYCSWRLNWGVPLCTKLVQAHLRPVSLRVLWLMFGTALWIADEDLSGPLHKTSTSKIAVMQSPVNS